MDDRTKKANGEKIRRFFNLENIEKVIALFSAALILPKGINFIYQAGYLNALNVSLVHIDLGNMGFWSYLLLFAGFAIFLMISNCIVYFLVEDKDIKKTRKVIFSILLFLVEMAFFIGGIALAFNITPIEFVKAMLCDLSSTIVLLISAIILIAVANLLGYVSAMGEKTGASKRRYGIIDILVFCLVCFVIICFSIYDSGASKANNKRSYKVIVENADIQNEPIDSKYIFEVNGIDVKICPILHETEEKYIVAYLYYNSEMNKCVIDYNRQSLMDKEGKETQLYEDFYNEDWNSLVKNYREK